MSNTRTARACAKKVHDTTLDDDKYNWPRRGAVHIDKTRNV